MFPCGNSQLGLPGCIQNIDIQSIRKKLQKNQKTYRNLCKLPISANEYYLELAMISPSFSEKKEKKNTPAVFAFHKKTPEKSLGENQKSPFARGAANRRARRCCQGFWARGWRAQRSQTGAAGRTDQQPRGVHGRGKAETTCHRGLVDKRTRNPGLLAKVLSQKAWQLF